MEGQRKTAAEHSRRLSTVAANEVRVDRKDVVFNCSYGALVLHDLGKEVEIYLEITCFEVELTSRSWGLNRNSLVITEVLLPVKLCYFAGRIYSR